MLDTRGSCENANEACVKLTASTTNDVDWSVSKGQADTFITKLGTDQAPEPAETLTVAKGIVKFGL